MTMWVVNAILLYAQTMASPGTIRGNGRITAASPAPVISGTALYDGTCPATDSRTSTQVEAGGFISTVTHWTNGTGGRCINYTRIIGGTAQGFWCCIG